MPICISGMHRSGTSMVTKLLHLCGVYLGPEGDLMPARPENPDGFWENMEFFALNEEIIQEQGEGWDRAHESQPAGGASGALERLKGKAEMLVHGFAGHEPWGWKDPRNCLTLPFWLGFFPQLKVVHCVRNPLEVALSLRKRNILSYTHGLALWKAFNLRALAATPPPQLLLTHYESYFDRPRRELRRVLNFLRLPVPSETIERSCTAITRSLRHGSFTRDDLIKANTAPDILELYDRLCAQAGRPSTGVLDTMAPDCSNEAKRPLKMLDSEVVELDLLRREVKALRPTVAGQKRTIQSLEEKLAEQQSTIRQLEEMGVQQQATAAALQETIRVLESKLDEQQAWQVQLQQLREEIRNHGQAKDSLHCA